jgi:hypothetical protein
MANLMTIATELRLAIVENVCVLDWTMTMAHELTISQVSSNEDKKNLCLACKALNLLVTPLLYKDMAVGVSRLSPAFAGTLTVAHPGIPHVRTLQIRSGSNSLDHILGLSHVNVATLIQLVSIIPQNALTRFQ